MQAIAFLKKHLSSVTEVAKNGSISLPSEKDIKELKRDDWTALKVMAVARAYTQVHKGTRSFRPVQLASILLNVRAASSGSGLLVEMKTGEGKTDVCAAIAAVLSKSHPKHAVHIVTSSSDRAADDCRATKDFIKEFTGKEPTLASEGVKWGEEGAGIVYAQVTDIQKMVVDEMRKGHQKALKGRGCCRRL